jgi:hypothetical protein
VTEASDRGDATITSKLPETSSLYYPRWREIARGAGHYLVSSATTKLLATWLAAGSDARPPGRRNLQPETMPALLADIWLMDYLPETARLRYRLAGENIRARYGRALVNHYLEDFVPPKDRERVVPYFLACVQKPAVCMVVGRLYIEWERPGYGERLLLPLLDPTGAPEGLLGMTICKQSFDSQEEAEARAKRVTVILPLDGSPASEVQG